MLHGAGAGCAIGTEVVAVALEGFIHETAASQDDPPSLKLRRASAVTEVADTTTQGLSLWEGAAGVEDGLDGFGAESGRAGGLSLHT